jgi:hypothetical protein
MKKVSFTSVALLIMGLALSAQSNTEEIELFQSIFGMEKKAIVSEFLQFDDSAYETFWGIYDAYETDRKELGKNRINLLKNYAENYDQLTDQKIDELMADMIKQKSNLDKLVNKYYKKIKKSVGSKPAAQFLQIENYFLSAVRLSIFESIPFIGELDY